MMKNKYLFFLFFLITFFSPLLRRGAGGEAQAQVIPVDPASAAGTYTISSYPGNFTAYYEGFSVVFRSNHNSPGASTLQIGVAAAKPIVNAAGSPLIAGDIKTDQVVIVYYDVNAGGRFQMVTASGNAGGAGSGWSTSGNGSTVDGTHFIGTTNDIPFTIRVDNQKAGRIESDNGLTTGANTFWGYLAGNSNIVNIGFAQGLYNTAIGSQAMMGNSNGSYNTAIGYVALANNINGYSNTAVGMGAGTQNTSGIDNSALGMDALSGNTIGNDNIALGRFALYNNVAGSKATAVGKSAMHYANNTAAPFTNANVAVGFEALRGSAVPASNTGNWNAALGYQALWGNTSGTYNTATGTQALYNNSMGSFNTAIGAGSLVSNTTANQNTAIGASSLFSQSFNNFGASWNSDNVAIGFEALYSNQPINTTSGFRNVALGSSSLRSNTTGSTNTAAGAFSMYSNTNGSDNTAFGSGAMYLNTGGTTNTAVGVNALSNNVMGGWNTAVGASALFNNKVTSNAAFGTFAMQGNTYATQNVALGNEALYTQSFTNGNTPWASDNVAVGYQALYTNNPTGAGNGFQNTAVGSVALRTNTTGSYNTATGVRALNANNTGSQNTAIGLNALQNNTNGNNNTAVGLNALQINTTGSNNTALGTFAGSGFTNGSFNTFLGYGTDVSGAFLSNCVAIGGNGNLAIGASNSVRIGDASMTSIGGQMTWSGISDARIKDNIKEDVKGLSFILKLRPLTYNYNVDKENRIQGVTDTIARAGKYDIEKMRFSGFLAQEVDKTAREVGFEFGGVDKPKDESKLWGLRYAEFVVPLVKAMQEQQAMIDSLKNQNAEIIPALTELKAQNELLKALLNKTISLTKNQSADLKMEMEKLRLQLGIEAETKK